MNGFGPLDTLAGLGFPMDRESQPQAANASDFVRATVRELGCEEVAAETDNEFIDSNGKFSVESPRFVTEESSSC